MRCKIQGAQGEGDIRTCREKFVSGVNLLDIVQFVIMEPELRDCDDIWGVFVDDVLKVMHA